MTFLTGDCRPNCKMSLLSLPIEILTIIIRNLDTKSVCNLYESCEFFKNVIRTPGVVRNCRFSMSSLATVESLNLDFFSGISGHLKVLNLSAVQDLSILPVLKALEYMTYLEHLDVTYTNITILYFLDIIAVRPTLKNLAINFTFGHKKYRFTTDLLLKYQEACKGLEDVHFVGSQDNLLYGKEALIILNKSNLRTYNITIVGDDFVYTRDSNDEDAFMMELEEQENWDDITVMKKVSYFNVYIIQGLIYNDLFDLPIFELMELDMGNYEIILLQTHIRPYAIATPLMKRFICDYFGIVVNDLTELYPAVYGEVNLMAWNRELTQFDSKFYYNLFKILRELIPYPVDPSNFMAIPTNYKWHIVGVDSSRGVYSQSNFELNLFNAFKDKQDVKLTILFMGNITKPIIMKCDLLKRLTFLSLTGNVQYKPEFFKNLFLTAHSLITLSITNTTDTFSVLKMLEFLPKCTSLKNILLYLSEIYFFPLFGYLSACRNLENINLVSMKRSFHPLPNPTSLFRNCTNLYCLYIKADIKDRQKTLEVYEKIKSNLDRNYINIDIVRFSGKANDCKCPNYFSVFNMYALQPSRQ